MNKGTQIVYIPNHAKGILTHEDCESGFVVSVAGDFAICRFWKRQQWGVLRTKNNSEATPVSNLVLCISGPQSDVDAVIKALEL